MTNPTKKLPEQIKAFFKTIGLIFLLLFYNIIPIIILQAIGLNYNTFSMNNKMIVLEISSILFLLFILYIYRNTIINDFKKFINNNLINNLKIAFIYWLKGTIVMIGSNFIISTIILNNTIASNEQSIRELLNIFPIFMAYMTIIYAPITEELIFRKSIKDIFNNKFLYIITSGIVFGAAHVISSLTSPLELLYIIPYSALGIAFAACYSKTKNIFSTITIHSFHNFLTLLILLIGKMIG